MQILPQFSRLLATVCIDTRLYKVNCINRHCVLNAYQVPGNTLNYLHVLLYLILTAIQGGAQLCLILRIGKLRSALSDFKIYTLKFMLYIYRIPFHTQMCIHTSICIHDPRFSCMSVDCTLGSLRKHRDAERANSCALQ